MMVRTRRSIVQNEEEKALTCLPTRRANAVVVYGCSNDPITKPTIIPRGRALSGDELP